MKTFLTALLFGLCGALAATTARAEDVQFDQQGLTFTHPKDWTVKADPKKEVTVITVVNGKGSTVTITLNAPAVDPKLISTELDKTFRKIFEGKIVKESDKPSKRKLLGAERDGQTLDIEILKGVVSHLEFYSFKTPSEKNTISVTLQTSSFDPDAKKVVEAIGETLAEKK